MKVITFHENAYRFLPEDFEKRYASSVVTTPYHELTNPAGIAESFAWHLDELLETLRLGYDGVAITEHGQSSYDMVPNPCVLGGMIANAIRQEEPEKALVVIGRSLAKTREPLRIAEEYAMLDAMSGGRLVAGFPMGLSYDANVNQGLPAVETRARAREAHDLILRAWTATQPFTWNGKYSQYRTVNPWPRPVQRPRPPVWIPGGFSPATMAWTLDAGYALSYLSWDGPSLVARRIFDQFWGFAEERGLPRNPYRVAWTQNVGVAETDERAECEYGPWLERAFRHGPGSIPDELYFVPGYVDKHGLEAMMRHPERLGIAPELRTITLARLLDTQAVMLGSPATLVDQITAFVTEYRIGNLMLVMQMGEMPHQLALKNMRMFSEDVLPSLQRIWDDEEWGHEWWPTGVAATTDLAQA
jgi:alkanesulfonate monooxygenase SsuD/methylene tetrahydromethanopterin reductase-like flavin-dependent oxidoreductase (luciferase family)